jgi:hypothetical protein
VNRLDSGRVIIERDDFAPGVRHCRLDTRLQIGIPDRWRQRLSQRRSDPGFDHVAIGFAAKPQIRGEALLRGCTPRNPMLIAGMPLLPRPTESSGA